MGLPDGSLQSRNFRPLQARNVISVAGTAVAIVAIPFTVMTIGGPASDVGVVQAADWFLWLFSCCWVAWSLTSCPVIGSGGRLYVPAPRAR